MLNKLPMFLYRIMSIRHGEERKLVGFSLAYFFLSMAIGFLANILDSLFLGTELVIRNNVDLVPIALVISSITIIILSLIYSYYTDKFDKRASLIFVILFSAIITFIFWIMYNILRNIDELWILLLVLYIFRLVITTFIIIQFWEMMNSYFDFREGKRLFPIILMVGTIGYSLASFILVLTSYTTSLENNLIIIVICLIISGLFLYNARIYTPLTPRERKKTVSEEIKSIFEIVKKNKFITIFTFSTMIFGIAAGLILYTYNDIVTGLGFRNSGLAMFLGIWRGSANLIIGIIQSAIIIQLMSQSALGKNFFLTLIIKITTFILFLIIFMFSMVATADFSRQILQALVSPAAIIALSILPRNIKGKIMNINNGIISQIGLLISGAMLQFLKYLNFQAIHLLGIILGLLAIRIVFNYIINREYLNTLFFNIKKTNLINISNNMNSIVLDKNLFNNLMEQYQNQDTSLKIFILNNIKPHLTSNINFIIEKLKILLINEEDPKIKLTIIKIFYNIDSINISDIVISYLNYNTPELHKIAILYLFKFGKEEIKTSLNQELLKCLRNCENDEDKYLCSISIIEELGNIDRTNFIPIIREKLITGSVRIKNKTILTMAKLDPSYSFGIIMDLMKDDNFRKNSLKALSIIGEKAIEGLIANYRVIEDKEFTISSDIINVIGEIESDKSVNFLREEFVKNSKSLQQKIKNINDCYIEYDELKKINELINSIINIKIGNLFQVKKIAEKTSEIYLERSIFFVAMIKQINNYIKSGNINTDIALIFKKLCDEEIEENALIAAKILALIKKDEYKREKIIDSIKKFKNVNKMITSQAFESFEGLIKNRYGYIIPILVDTTISDEDKFNTLKYQTKNILVNIFKVIKYWSSLKEKTSNRYIYKKLIADRILELLKKE